MFSLFFLSFLSLLSYSDILSHFLPQYISGSYPSDAAAEADRVAKIAARYEDYACVNYTTIIYSSLSPNSTAVLANNTALDLVEARRLAVIAAAEVDVAAGVLAEASATADSNSVSLSSYILHVV